MNALTIGGLLLGGGLLAKLVFGKKAEPSEGGAPADAGAVVPVDSSGTVVTPETKATTKAKIPMPQKPVGWKPVPVFLIKDGVYFYNPAYVDTLRAILAAYKFIVANASGTSVKIAGEWPGTGLNALDWARQQQKAGMALVAPLTLLKGPEGQAGASLIAVPKSYVNPEHINSTKAVLPNL